MLAFQRIHRSSSEYYRTIAICSSQFVKLQASLQSLPTAWYYFQSSAILCPLLLANSRLTNVCTLLAIWVATFYDSHPHSNTN
jgi:hypothetical protein